MGRLMVKELTYLMMDPFTEEILSEILPIQERVIINQII